LQEVLEKARKFFMADASKFSMGEKRGPSTTGEKNDSLLTAGQAPEAGRDSLDMRFSSITGVVIAEEKARFERMIFRATRGNVYVRFAPINEAITDPITGLLVEKVVFVVFYKSIWIESK